MAQHIITTQPYLYEKYSVFDIKDYLESQGYECFFSDEALLIKDCDVSVDLPSKDVNDLIFAHINMPNIDLKYDENLNKKVFALLKKNFGRKASDPYPSKQEAIIKDNDRINDLKRGNGKKGWQFWK